MGLHDRIVVRLAPYDAACTRAELSGEGMDDILRDVRAYSDDHVLKDAHTYAEEVEFPATMAARSQHAEERSHIGDLERTDITFTVELRDLMVAGLYDGTGPLPFKKADRVVAVKDWAGNVLREYDDLYVTEVANSDPRLHFAAVTLVCGSRNAFV